MTKRIIILASGSGSNAENIFEFFKGDSSVEVVAFATNKREAGIYGRAERLGVPLLYFSKAEMNNPEALLPQLRALNLDLIVLAGFLLKMPTFIVDAYANQIINIHPSLLPKFGGKGMYGMNVHKAVKEAKEATSGMTIHWVNANYDEGAIIHQESTAIAPSDTPEDIAKKVQALEYNLYPVIIQKLLQS